MNLPENCELVYYQFKDVIFAGLLPDDDEFSGVTGEVRSDEYSEETEETIQFSSERIIQAL